MSRERCNLYLLTRFADYANIFNFESNISRTWRWCNLSFSQWTSGCYQNAIGRSWSLSKKDECYRSNVGATRWHSTHHIILHIFLCTFVESSTVTGSCLSTDLRKIRMKRSRLNYHTYSPAFSIFISLF